MQKLPNDIEAKIFSLFDDSKVQAEVKELISGLWHTSLNVGEVQLARSILILSDGQLTEIKKIFQSSFYGDPRDVIMMAERRSGNPGHYFVDGF